MTYLLIFTIGPVQSFIASARKTQDLFAGSAILSNLTNFAYHRLNDEIKASGNIVLIFPELDAPSKKATNPNRFAALIKDYKGDLASIIDKIKRDVIEINFANEAINELKKDLPANKTLHPNAIFQLKSLPEIFWAAIQLENEKEDYVKKYSLLESYLGGIKNIRNLKQLKEAGRKCNVDGVHNAIIYREVNDNETWYKLHIDSDNPVMVIKKADERFAKIWELSPGEGLSAVSFYKRRFLKNPHEFPSTARIALMHLLVRAEVMTLKEFREYNELVGREGKIFRHSDDQLFYEENINGSVIGKASSSGMLTDDFKDKTGEALDKIKTARGLLSAEMKAKNLEDFTTKYYALLMFDGDKMGEWLSGLHLVKPEDTLFSYQKKLSKLLHDFAVKAREILIEPDGKTVYAAGEDFLGFVNLNSLLLVLCKLRRKFDEMVNQELKNEKVLFQIKPDTNLTFSAGIAIAHYKQPLPTVLEETRSAEKKAKDNGGNNCCMSIMRHSGGTTRCILPFGEERNTDNVLQLKSLTAFDNIVNEIKADRFSNAFIYQLIREMLVWQNAQPVGMFQTEAHRLIARASNHKKEQKDAALIEFYEDFKIIAAYSEYSDFRKEQADNTFNTLRIADFIQRNLKGEPV